MGIIIFGKAYCLAQLQNTDLMKHSRLLWVVAALLLVPVTALPQTPFDSSVANVSNVGKQFFRHDVSLTTGFLPYRGDLVYSANGYIYGGATYYYESANVNQYYQQSILDRYENSKYYRTEPRSTWAFNFNYFYSPWRFFSIGVNLSYHKVERDLLLTATRQVYSTLHKHYYAITPTARFTYLNREKAKLYSAIGIGYGHVTINDSGTDARQSFNYTAWNITFVGFSYGKRLYVVGEAGILSTGFVRAGAGYRF